MVRANADMRFYTNGHTNERMRITSGSNVLIGTTTDAGYKLDVNGTLRVTGAATFSGSVTASSLIFKDAINSNSYGFRGLSGIITLDAGSVYPTGWNFQYGGGASSALYINGSGNVGIGTTIPGFQLDVLSAGGDQAFAPQTLQVRSTNGTSGQGTGIRLSSVGGSKETVGILSVENTSSTNGDMVFRLYNGGATMNEKMRITSGGNLGIGVTPSAWATSNDVRAIQLKAGAFWNYSNFSTYFGNNYYWDGSARRYIISDFASEYQQVYGEHVWFTAPTGTAGNSATFTERMRITSGGNVLIGTTTDAGDKLVSNGGVRIMSPSNNAYYRTIYASTDGNFYFYNGTNQGYINSAGSFVNASDIRLKKNIIDIKYGLNDILKIQARSYNRVDVDGEYIGFIAQEIKKIIPEVVSGDESKQLGVDYGSLVALAFKGIQELSAQIKELQTKIQTLENK